MNRLIAWCGFFGAWCLVAGPLYQSSIELREQDIARDKIAEVNRTYRQDPVSPWWWLFPPARYVLARRRLERNRDALLAALEPDEMEDLVTYVNKAFGWLFVGTGGTLIALVETWNLREHYDWPVAIFWLLVVVMLLASVGNVIYRARRAARILAHHEKAVGGLIE
jgi:hypothetical protein